MSRLLTHLRARWLELLAILVVTGALYGGATLHDALYPPTLWSLVLGRGAVGALIIGYSIVLIRKPWRQLRLEREERAAKMLATLREQRGTQANAQALARLEVESRGFLATCWHTRPLRYAVIAFAMTWVIVIGVEILRIEFGVGFADQMLVIIMAGLLVSGASMIVGIAGALKAFETWSSHAEQRQVYRDMETLRERRFQGMVPGELSMTTGDASGGLTEHDEANET